MPRDRAVTYGAPASRAGRVAFTLGLLLALAAVAGFVAVKSFDSLTESTSSSALELYNDDGKAFKVSLPGYEVDFPDQPDQRGTKLSLIAFGSTDEVEGNLWEFQADGEQTTFAAITFERREAFRQGAAPSAEVLARTVLAGYVESVKGKATELTSVRKSKVDAWDAIVRYSVRRPDNLDFFALVRIFVDDDTLFFLRVSSTRSGGQRAGFDRFASSFTPVRDEG